MSSPNIRGKGGMTKLEEEVLELDITIVDVRRWLNRKNRWQVPW